MCLAYSGDLVTTCGLPTVELSPLLPAFPRRGHKKGLEKMAEDQGSTLLVRHPQDEHDSRAQHIV